MKSRIPITIGPVSKGIDQDPRYKSAQGMLDKDIEVTDWASGLNKALSQILGTKQIKDLQGEYSDRDASYKDTLTNALAAMAGKPATQSMAGPQNPNMMGPQQDKVNWNEQAPNSALAAELLGSNPDTSDLGLQLGLSDLQNKQAQALEMQKYTRDRADKAADFEKDADLKREMASLKSGGTVTINPETGEIEATPGPKKLSATEQKEFYEAKDVTDSVSNALGTLDQVQNLSNEDMFTGLGSTVAAFGNRVPIVGRFIDDEKAANTTTYNNLLKELAYSRLKATFPGAISNSEREALERLQALSSYSKPEQKKIISEARKVLERQAGIAKAKQGGIVTGEVYTGSAKAESGGKSDKIRQYLSGKGMAPDAIEVFIKSKGL